MFLVLALWTGTLKCIIVKGIEFLCETCKVTLKLCSSYTYLELHFLFLNPRSITNVNDDILVAQSTNSEKLDRILSAIQQIENRLTALEEREASGEDIIVSKSSRVRLLDAVLNKVFPCSFKSQNVFIS